jgi:hypothetical protein
MFPNEATRYSDSPHDPFASLHFDLAHGAADGIVDDDQQGFGFPFLTVTLTHGAIMTGQSMIVSGLTLGPWLPAGPLLEMIDTQLIKELFVCCFEMFSESFRLSLQSLGPGNNKNLE